jgi:uncharacterized protein HemX
MTGEIAAELLKNGVLGIAVLALGIAVWTLWKSNTDIQAARLKDHQDLQAQRVRDAQAVTEQLLKTNSECVTALTNVTSAMEAQREAMTELKGAFRDLADEVRTGRPSRR